jgi:hypothetical protein
MKFSLPEPEDGPNESNPPPEREHQRGEMASQIVYYSQDAGGMARTDKDSSKVTMLTNFSARIVRDILLEDGEQGHRELGIEAELPDGKVYFALSTAEFRRMDWVLNHVGPKAIIYPGQQHHTRAAIQWLSGGIRQKRVFTHIGWRKHGSRWIYLHAGGALGADGPEPEIEVQLPAVLQAFQLQFPHNSEEIADAVKASLGCLSVAPDRISFPLLASVYRAALGNVDFSVFLTGQTGVFKTALAALSQQHFGAAMDAANLPGNFASTGNALEGMAFYAKDALLVVDDFAPTGRHDDGELHRTAERLIRGAGNRQGRSRLTGNGRLSSPKPPRTLVLATGEQLPPGQSIRARLLVVELAPGEVDCATLSDCQRAGYDGQLSMAMGAYLSWVATHYEGLQERLRDRVHEIRRDGRGGATHARLPGTLAQLESGWEIFLDFAVEVGAINKVKQRELKQRNLQASGELAELQIKHRESDPASRFVSLLQAALIGGHAHVADQAGGVPLEGVKWGWHRKSPGQAWISRGTRIGWVSGTDLFLDPGASYQVAETLAGSERLGVTGQTLRHRLREHGLLRSTDLGRQTLTVRRIVEGIPSLVLHLKSDVLLGSRANLLASASPQAAKSL